MEHVTWTFRPHILLVVLCLLGAAPASRAGGNPVLKEEDISEQAITNALVPHVALPNDPAANEPADRTETLGIRFRDGPAMPDGSAGPAAAASANLLITFTSNSAKLTRGARVALDKVARGLKSNQLSPYRFRVEGHADPRGSAPANLKLSESRAEAVVEYLSTEGGVPASRLTPVGKGSAEPLNMQNPSAPENRRVTIVTVQP